MVNFRYNIVAAAIAFVAALAAVATVQQKFEADLVAQLTSSAPEVVGCDLCKDLCSSQQVCIYNKKMNTTRCLRSGIFTSNSLNKYERSGWEVCEYEDTDDDECPDPPPCAVPPENCKYVRPVYDDNKCLISCGEIICEGDDDDDDDDKCAPIKCADGREFPSCKDGYPLNYFVDPCRSLCGNGKCEEGEADEINPGGCGPDAPPECLGPPAYYKKGTCPQDCPSDCADDGKSVFKKPALGSTHCCSKNAGVKPPSLLEDNGLCSPPEDGSVGICVQDWWRTCGDGTCDRSEEDRCSCPKDCIEQECVKAGGKTPVVPDAPECCEGLKKISVAFPDDNTSEQMVDENNCIAAVGAVICSDCGNDKCEPWENGCNCKEDCGPCSGSCPSYAAPYCPDGDLIPTDEDECGCKLPSICCGDNKCGDREDTKICWKDCRADVCTSNSDCEKPFICSTSQGDCKPHPDCKLGGGCPDVCTGECVHPSADDDDDDNDDDDSDDDDNDDDDSDDDDDDDNDDDDDDIYSCALPADSQLDIATDDEYLYLVAWDQYGEENSKMEQYIYKIDGQCNVLERFSVPTEGGYLFGLSYGDGAFWASSGDSKHLVKLTKDFKVEKVFDLPYGAAQGVGYFRGKVYTVYNTAADEVTITDVDSGKTEFLFTAPANAPYGLAVEGETIWMGANGNIYALDENGKILHTIVSPTERGYISGLAILDEDNLFIVDNSDDRLYHMQLPHISDDVFVCCENTGKCKMLCDQGVCPSGMCENVPQECCRESGGCGPSCPSVGGNDNDDFECGDGVIDILEDCDDDNDESGDGCSQN
ncbi:hypothetical protein KKC44_05485, partial [Patescibacteria group bacterium]|nr:hypothetical protein [Patescibacteria group bacterium]